MSRRKFYTTKKIRGGDTRVGDCMQTATMRGEVYWVEVSERDGDKLTFSNGETLTIENPIALVDIQVEDD